MKQQTIRPRKLRIAASAAHRLRERLLLHDSISASDMRMLLTILDDVYPRPKTPTAILSPLLVGIGLGLVIAFLLLLSV